MKLLFLILSLLVASSLQSYQPNLSKELWRASSLAYFDKSDINHMNCGAPCDDLKGFQLSSQYNTEIAPGQPLSYSVFYNKDQHKAIFAFKGTHDLIQLANEAPGMGSKDYNLHNIPNAKATDYFYSNYKNFLRDSMLKETKKMKAQCPTCDFYFTGHSLGGALTTLGALDASMSGLVDKSKIHLYTYGSPRVGNGNFAEAVNKHVPDSYRVVHHNDIVPKFPPCKEDKNHQCIHSKDASYHVGTEVFYNDAKNPHKFEICKKPEDPNCSKKGFHLLSGIGDHDKYLGMERNVKKQLEDAKKKHPVTHPTTKPTSHPTSHPTTHPTKPTTHPTRLRPNGTHPATHPTAHPTHPTKLRPNGTHPSTHPTIKPTHPTHPTTKPTTHPTTHPTTKPTAHPTAKPSHPTTHPTSHPTSHPTTKPTTHPTTHPTAKPTSHPTTHPVSKPTPHPTAHPVAKPTPKPTPAPHPVAKPAPHPIAHPVAKPVPHPTPKPTPAPHPVAKPAPHPTPKPTPQPVHKPQPVHRPTPTHH